MDTNQLFRELRSDPKKVSGDLNRDMNKFNAKGSVQMNQSYAMSSFHYGPDQSSDASAQVIDNIANDFVKDMANMLGLP